MNNAPQELWHPQTAQSETETDMNSNEPAHKDTSKESISWEASEYIHHEKDGLWFAGVIVGGLLLVVVSLFVFRSWTFTALSVVMVVAIIVMAVRPPRTMRYQLDSRGITVGEQSYSYDDFSSFGVQHENGIYSLVLLPVKRFRPSVSIYFPPEQGEQIVEAIGSRIPMIEIKPDLVDIVTRKLRF